MSEEEIIEFLKTDIAFNEQEKNKRAEMWVSFEKATLDLIDKLQKELLHWKGQYHLLSRKIDCISKDKIRELREIDNIDHLQFKLKELLGDDDNE